MSNQNVNTTTTVATTTANAEVVAYQPSTFSLNTLCDEGKKYPSICTMQGNTAKDKLAIANALINCDEEISKQINIPLDMVGFFIEETMSEKIDQLTGETRTDIFPRIIIFTKDGKAYGGGSVGLYNAINNLVRTLGTPDQWDDNVCTIVVKTIDLGDGKSTMTFNVMSIGDPCWRPNK